MPRQEYNFLLGETINSTVFYKLEDPTHTHRDTFGGPEGCEMGEREKRLGEYLYWPVYPPECKEVNEKVIGRCNTILTSSKA